MIVCLHDFFICSSLFVSKIVNEYDASRLLHGKKLLDKEESLHAAGVGDGAELTMVVDAVKAGTKKNKI